MTKIDRVPYIINTVILCSFIGMKIGGVITWSWWWVVSPLWISVGLSLVFVVVLVLIKKILIYNTLKQLSKDIEKQLSKDIETIDYFSKYLNNMKHKNINNTKEIKNEAK